MHAKLKINLTQFADELFECVWPFCGIRAKRVNMSLKADWLAKIISLFKEKGLKMNTK